MNNKKGALDFLPIGLALFAMFFGAGNLIFPPELGVKSGGMWFIGFLCFLLADAGLAVLGVYAMGKADGEISKVTGTMGQKAAVLLNTAVILCIGPGVCIPRTATVSYELGAAPVFGLAPSGLPLAIYSVVFFVVVLALTIRPSAVVDIIGKFLTPFLVIALVVLIIVGFVSPAASVTTPVEGFDMAETIRYGVNQGYQTMDGMAALFFGIIIISSIKAKGYTEEKAMNKELVKASAVAAVLLFIVYGGLAFLGATTGTLWKAEVAEGAISQAALVANIINELLGYPGIVILGIAVILACLTTAIGLVSAASDYFSEFCKDEEKRAKIYQVMVVVMCVISAFLANLGLAQIIALAAPILGLVYPVVVFLLITSLFQKQIKKRMAYSLGAAAAFIVSLLTVCSAANGGFFGIKVAAFDFINNLPLGAYGFNWVLPTIILMVVGMILPGKKLEGIE